MATSISGISLRCLSYFINNFQQRMLRMCLRSFPRHTESMKFTKCGTVNVCLVAFCSNISEEQKALEKLLSLMEYNIGVPVNPIKEDDIWQDIIAARSEVQEKNKKLVVRKKRGPSEQDDVCGKSNQLQLQRLPLMLVQSMLAS
ncbi:uncharacterized protein LOC143227951 isoform X5 [Tachypleus tridentatus]|uniref:uncharacterized protein LOC143227951 isoform X5 n=1 Tax=Tachypleus tridentatus TaxID=6853 RepID=UPI003FD159EB